MIGYDSWKDVLNEVNKKEWAKFSGARPIWLNSKPIYDFDVANSQSLSKLRTSNSILAITENAYQFEIDKNTTISSKSFAFVNIHATTQEFAYKRLPAGNASDKEHKYNALKSINDYLHDIIDSESFCLMNNLEADSDALYELQLKYGLSSIYLNVDPAKKVIVINTSDFILASLHPDEFAAVVKLNGKQLSEQAVRMLVETTNINGSLLLGEYYYKHLGNISGKYQASKYAQVGMIRDSLKDIIPIAIKFSDTDSSNEIDKVNATNIYFDNLLDKSTQIMNNPYISQEQFNQFQDSLIVFSAPVSVYGNSSMENQILFATKSDLLWLTGILFHDHTIDLIAQVFVHLITSLYANIPYGTEAWREKFSRYCASLGTMKGAQKSHSFQIVNAINGEMRRDK